MICIVIHVASSTNHHARLSGTGARGGSRCRWEPYVDVVLILIQIEPVVEADRPQDVVADVVRTGFQQGGADFRCIAAGVPNPQNVAQFDVLDGCVVDFIVFLKNKKNRGLCWITNLKLITS